MGLLAGFQDSVFRGGSEKLEIRKPDRPDDSTPQVSLGTPWSVLGGDRSSGVSGGVVPRK